MTSREGAHLMAGPAAMSKIAKSPWSRIRFIPAGKGSELMSQGEAGRQITTLARRSAAVVSG